MGSACCTAQGAATHQQTIKKCIRLSTSNVSPASSPYPPGHKDSVNAPQCNNMMLMELPSNRLHATLFYEHSRAFLDAWLPSCQKGLDSQG